MKFIDVILIHPFVYVQGNNNMRKEMRHSPFMHLPKWFVSSSSNRVVGFIKSTRANAIPILQSSQISCFLSLHHLVITKTKQNFRCTFFRSRSIQCFHPFKLLSTTIILKSQKTKWKLNFSKTKYLH